MRHYRVFGAGGGLFTYLKTLCVLALLVGMFMFVPVMHGIQLSAGQNFPKSEASLNKANQLALEEVKKLVIGR